MPPLPALAAAALPPLLHAYWILATGAVVATWCDAVPERFKAAVRLASHRGKTWDGAKKGGEPLGRVISSWAVPQRWFLHFYVLGLASTSAVITAYGSLACAEPAAAAAGWWGWRAATPTTPLPSGRAAAMAALLLLWLHLARRLAECVGLTRWPAGARMHGLAYLFSISYYAVLPLSFLPEPDFGPLAAAGLATGRAPDPLALLRRSLPALGPVAALGALLFAAGSALQAAAHVSLARLQAEAAAAGVPYLMPRAGLLARVTCPHYSGEVLLYLGLALLASPPLSPAFRPLPWLVLAWVGCNLVLGAAEADTWYGRTFAREWTRVRRARLVPGVW